MKWVICDICDCQYPKFLSECPRRLDPLGHPGMVKIDGEMCFVDEEKDDIEQDLEGWPQ